PSYTKSVSWQHHRGKLVSLLDDFLPQFPGFYLYFPQRRNIAPKLRALIDHVKEWRQQLA
ncbi:TPA: hypothetical protein N6Q82_005345, partial [Escherichia coli]|nr:hypothetical protein [Escherichia coli]